MPWGALLPHLAGPVGQILHCHLLGTVIYPRPAPQGAFSLHLAITPLNIPVLPGVSIRGGSLCWMCCCIPDAVLGMMTLALWGQSCDSPLPAFVFLLGVVLLGSSAGLPARASFVRARCVELIAASYVQGFSWDSSLENAPRDVT